MNDFLIQKMKICDNIFFFGLIILHYWWYHVDLIAKPRKSKFQKKKKIKWTCEIVRLAKYPRKNIWPFGLI